MTLIGVDGYDLDKIIHQLPQHINLRGLNWQKAENLTRRKLKCCSCSIIAGIPEIQYFFRDCFAGNRFIEVQYLSMLNDRKKTRYRLFSKMHYDIIILVQEMSDKPDKLESRYTFNPQVITQFLSFNKVYIVSAGTFNEVFANLVASLATC